jgi:formylmethanofuran dehydrogenase subunit E
MFYRTDDPVADFLAYDQEQEEWRKRRPKCSECGEHIMDETHIYIGGKHYCHECINHNEVDTDQHMKGD